MSRISVCEQLSSNLDGFIPQAAQCATENAGGAGWDEDALAEDKSYLKTMPPSSDEIYKQLPSESEGLT